MKPSRLKKFWPRKANPIDSSRLPSSPSQNALENYVKSVPSIQNALDIFKGEWATKLPGPLGRQFQTGSVPAFEDPVMAALIKELGGVAGMSVLELGPLEGGHTYMLETLGASGILSIEANKRAYLKCLVIKEVLKLQRATFMCGDFVEYLRAPSETFDLCLVSGVLYHMLNPVELIALAAGVSDRLYLWTHYYDHQVISRKSSLIPKFPSHKSGKHKGLFHTLYRYEYQSALDFQGFCGGSSEHSHWLTRADILRSLEHFGFDEIHVGWEQPDHQNGPALALVAIRSEGRKRAARKDP